MDGQPRRAGPGEADALAGLWLASRAAAAPVIPPPVHTDEEVRAWFRSVVLASREVWVIGAPDAPLGLLVLDGDWIDQLYVRPGATGHGLGGRLVELAQRRRDHLLLWTFQANAGARRFYERHGFSAEQTTTGDNEEGAPDVRYRWSRSGPAMLAGVTAPAAQPTQTPLVLSEAEVAEVLDPLELLDRLAQAFVIVSDGRASVPPRPAATTPQGLLSVMPGYLPGVGLGTKQVSVYPGNEQHGLPSHLAVISLFDEATGALLCVMDGTHITTSRTAGGAALSTRLLARPDASVLTILGAGVEGAAHLTAVSRVRDIREIRVASRTFANAERLAATDERATAVPSFEEAVRGADIVCCCTNTQAPIVRYEWFSAGTHVTSVGFNVQGGELDEATVTRGHLFVEARDAFSPPPAGCYELQGLDPATGTEMGDLVAGRAPGRRSAEEITVYRSMGHAAEDLAAARLAYDRAVERGVGTRVAL